MNEVKAAVLELEKKADMYTKLAQALRHLGLFAEKTGVRSRSKRSVQSRRKLSRAGRARIAAAQKKRWAKFRQEQDK